MARRLAFWVIAFLRRGATCGQVRSTVGLQIEPAQVVLSGNNARQQLAVTMCLQDGSLCDVTSRCRFVVEPSGVAAVTAGGVVVPEAPGHARIRADFGEESAQIEVQVDRDAPKRTASFRTDVVPLLSKAGCNMGTCHGNLSGKGGFRLSLRGDDPAFDHQALTRDLGGRRLSRIAPGCSLIVQKPTGTLAHEGGRRFPLHSTEAKTLLDWIAAGAGDDGAGAPRVKTLRVFPGERVLAPGALDQQLLVNADVR